MEREFSKSPSATACKIALASKWRAITMEERSFYLEYGKKDLGSEDNRYICNQKDIDNIWVCCDCCDRWYHCSCMAIKPVAIEVLPYCWKIMAVCSISEEVQCMQPFTFMKRKRHAHVLRDGCTSRKCFVELRERILFGKVKDWNNCLWWNLYVVIYARLRKIFNVISWANLYFLLSASLSR